MALKKRRTDGHYAKRLSVFTLVGTDTDLIIFFVDEIIVLIGGVDIQKMLIPIVTAKRFCKKFPSLPGVVAAVYPFPSSTKQLVAERLQLVGCGMIKCVYFFPLAK